MPLLSLSEDVLLRIFRLMPIQCACTVAQACSLLAQVQAHPTLWHFWLQTYFPGSSSTSNEPRQCFLDLRGLDATGLHVVAIDATAQDPSALQDAACRISQGGVVVWRKRTGEMADLGGRGGIG